MIRLINLKNYKLKPNEMLIKVDRRSVLGNPFIMEKESNRHNVCVKYKEYFDRKIKANDKEFLRELNFIKNMSKIYNVALGCWCHPKECHADTILEYCIEE